MSLLPADEALLPWALSTIDRSDADPLPTLSQVAGDASSRRYFRFEQDGQRFVVAHAPPETEKNDAFIAVRNVLASAGVRVPALYGADLERGFLLLEDLGDQLLLADLHSRSADRHYRNAFELLTKFAAVDAHSAGLADYDGALLSEELGRFTTWFVQALLGHLPDTAEQAVIEGLFSRLIDSALEQPQVLVHRDFHSRNLMLMAEGELAVIDFQDAVVGPVTYDLVSLLRDCYIQWPDELVDKWACEYRDLLFAGGQLDEGIDAARFRRWFDWMGLQRHIKVLGTFARLYLRDGKVGYLADLPLVVDYVLRILDKYAASEREFGEFRDWFAHTLSPLIATQHWSARP